MVTEGTFGRLKSRCRVHHKKFESDKGTVKIMAAFRSVLHNVCIDRGDVIRRMFDLSYDSTVIKRQDKESIAELLVSNVA